MGFFDNFSAGSWTKVGGIVGNVISGGYKSYQAMKQAEEQGDEYKRVGQANAKLAIENAKAAREQVTEIQRKGARELTVNYEKVNQVLSAQKASAADRGVISSSGSTKVISNETAHQGKVNAEIIAHNMRTDVERMKDTSEHYYEVAANNINEANNSAYLLERAAANRVGNILSDTFTSSVKTGYEIGVSEGLWGKPKKTSPPKVSTYY